MEVMTTEQVCNYHEVSRSVLNRWVASGILKPMPNGEFDAAKVRAFNKPKNNARKPLPKRASVKSNTKKR